MCLFQKAPDVVIPEAPKPIPPLAAPEEMTQTVKKKRKKVPGQPRKGFSLRIPRPGGGGGSNY